MKTNKNYDSENLNLTKQQTFNFDSKKIEDEEERKVARKIKNDKLKRKIQHIIDKKNSYKRKYTAISIISFGLLLIVVGMLGTYSFLKDDYKKLKTNYKKLDKKYQKLEKEPKMDENIVFLGDSITHGYDLEKYYPDNNVVNSGIDGNTTDDILSDMKNRVYNYNPSKVFVLIGINDYLDNKNNNYIYNNIKKIVNKIKENRPNSIIYIESVYPINDSNNKKISKTVIKNRNNNEIKELNKKIELYCKKQNIIYINLYKELLNEDDNLKLEYTKEGLHLNDNGYEFITKILKKYVNN